MQLRKLVTNKIHLFSMLLSCALFRPSALVADVASAQSSPMPGKLVLLSGRSIDIKADIADPEALKEYRQFFESSKAAYLSSPEDFNALGSVYAGVIAAREKLGNGDNSPIRLLSDLELMVLVSYSEWDYQMVNSYLWAAKPGANEGPDSVKVDTFEEAKILVTLSGLKKLPEVGPTTVFRGEYIGSKQPGWEAAKKRYDSIDPNQPYIFWGFMSTTRGIGEWAKESFVEPAALLYVIESQSGRDISNISTRGDEEEVLFLPMSRFEVTDKKIIATTPTQKYPFKQKMIIYLKEITP